MPAKPRYIRYNCITGTLDETRPPADKGTGLYPAQYCDEDGNPTADPDVYVIFQQAIPQYTVEVRRILAADGRIYYAAVGVRGVEGLLAPPFGGSTVATLFAVQQAKRELDTILAKLSRLP